MQETSLPQWDPASVDIYRPWEYRIFVLYSGIVLLISLVKWVSLGRQLWSFSISRRLSLQQHGTSNEKAELLARSGLANKLPNEAVAKAWAERDPLTLLQEAESRFLFLWEMCSAKVASLKRLGILTSLLSVLVFVSLTIRFLTDLTISKATGIAVITGSIAESLVPFSLGILVSAVLYAIYGFFQGVLIRRMASWNYFCRKADVGVQQAEVERAKQP
jgi:biopolymer transport protein ExbB/TolQ